MAHDEKPIGKELATIVQLIPEQTTLSATANTKGMIILSGAKLLFSTGSAWETVTSA